MPFFEMSDRAEKDGMTFGRAFWRTARYHAADALGFRVRPRKLRIAVTKRCNSRCAMCSAWQTPPSEEPEIAPVEISTIARSNRWYLRRVTHVSLTGGEPTLRRDLTELVRAVCDSFPRATININSNGFQMLPLLSVINETLAYQRRRLQIMLSLDGLGEVHNRVRGVPGAFSLVLRTINRLLALREAGQKISIEVNFVLTNQNADQMLPVFHFCRERDIEFNPIYPVHGELYANEIMDIGLEREAVQKFLEAVAEIRKSDRSLALRELEHQLRGYPRDFDCWAGRTQFLIEADCRVYPNGGCPPAFCLGSLRECNYSFRALLRSQQARQVLCGLRQCRLCRIPCETMTTLHGPEALAGYCKMCTPAIAPPPPGLGLSAALQPRPPRQRAR